jgi:hypothetical protein
MPQRYKLEEVKKWFGKLPIIDNPLDNPRINRHLQSLSNYGDNPVNSTAKKSDTAWHWIFNECLSDLENINNDSVEHYRGKFNERYSKFTSDLNVNLNTMTKKDFVELFAKTMDDIFTEEEQQEEQQEEKRKEEERRAAIEKSREEANRTKHFDDDGCEIGKEEFNTYENMCVVIGDRGGSKKKSNKRIRRKRRDSRRNKTRKYKKRN